MTTILYLVRHGATASNLATPPRLQGRHVNSPLHPVGVRQSELTRDFLGVTCIDACYASPLERALETAAILCVPHRLTPEILPDLTECNVGQWEGLTWDEIATRYPEEYRRFKDDPARFGYPGGETFADVHERSRRAIDELLAAHQGDRVLVVAHHVVNRTYLAGVMGLGPQHARRVTLDNCSVSVVVRERDETYVKALNCHFHLQGAAA